jgi:hypothetical protein
MTAIQWGRPPGLRAVPAGSSAAQRGEWCPISPPPGTSGAPPAAAPPTPSPAHRPPTPYSAYLRARRSETGRSIWSTYSAPSCPESASHVVFVSGNSIRGRFLPLAARVVMPVCSANRTQRPSRVTAGAANWKAPPSAPPAGTFRNPHSTRTSLYLVRWPGKSASRSPESDVHPATRGPAVNRLAGR